MWPDYHPYKWAYSRDDYFDHGLVCSAHAQPSRETNEPAIQHMMEGVYFFRQGHYPQAFDAFQKALILYHTAGDPNRQALMLRNLGVASLETNLIKSNNSRPELIPVTPPLSKVVLVF